MSGSLRRLGVAILLCAASACASSSSTSSPAGGARSLDVMSSGGFAAAYEVLAPGFTEASGIRLETAYGASMGGAPDSIPMRLDGGRRWTS